MELVHYFKLYIYTYMVLTVKIRLVEANVHLDVVSNLVDRKWKFLDVHQRNG